MSSHSVSGKTAVITGAGSGINYCFARLLLEKGCNVLIADLGLRPEAEQLIHQYKDKTRAVFHKCDVTEWSQLDQLLDVAHKEFGQVDIVCPGAGVFEPV
jgi:3-hydroxybutyrate dehydrogenase